MIVLLNHMFDQLLWGNKNMGVSWIKEACFTLLVSFLMFLLLHGGEVMFNSNIFAFNRAKRWLHWWRSPIWGENLAALRQQVSSQTGRRISEQKEAAQSFMQRQKKGLIRKLFDQFIFKQSTKPPFHPIILLLFAPTPSSSSSSAVFAPQRVYNSLWMKNTKICVTSL